MADRAATVGDIDIEFNEHGNLVFRQHNGHNDTTLQQQHAGDPRFDTELDDDTDPSHEREEHDDNNPSGPEGESQS